MTQRHANLGADGSNHNLLAGCHVGGAADNLHGVTAALIDSSYMQMVRIGMLHAGKNLTYHYILESALDRLNLLYSIDLETYRCKGCSHLIRGQIKVNILLKPLI